MDVSKIGLDGDGCGQDSNSPQELCRFWSPNGLFLVSGDPKLTHRKCQFLLRFESIPEYKVLTTKVPQPAMTQHRGDGRETVLVQLQARCAQGGPGLCPLAGWEDPHHTPPPLGQAGSCRLGACRRQRTIVLYRLFCVFVPTAVQKP